MVDQRASTLSEASVFRLFIPCMARVALGSHLLLIAAGTACAAAVADEIRHYAIGSAPLDQVLRDFALASGTLLSAEGALTAGLQSPGVQGALTREAGLRRLLAGTGLEAARQADGSYTLLLAGTAVGASHSLPTVEQPQLMPRIDVLADAGYLGTAPVTIGRLDLPGYDMPQAVTVIGRRQMRDQSVRSMADVLRYVPGIEASQGEGNRDNAVFRGYSSNADFYLDGVRDDVQYFRDFYNIERVEALKGPNAAASGRGGAGGIVNRVSKQATWEPLARISASMGAWSARRVEIDAGQPLSATLAARINGVAERGGSYRAGVRLERHGINPVVTVRIGNATLLTASAEHFRDERTTDRGIPSWHGRPVDTAASTFFGDAASSPNWVRIRAAGLGLEHVFDGGTTLQVRLRDADYDKYYQNVFPGAVDASGETVRLLAYGSATRRRNRFAQADLARTRTLYGQRHRFTAGAEVGRQVTDNFRTTGYFDSLGAGTRYVTVPVGMPVVSLPVAFRQSPTDIDNHGTARNVALYLQDQWQLGAKWEATIGVRHDRFDVDFMDRRTVRRLATSDRPLSPRAALQYRSAPGLTWYAAFTEAFMPRAGDQLASLTATTQALRPESMRNREIGVKWSPAPDLAATFTAYRLDRHDVAVGDPYDPNSSVLVDGQRSRGVEASLAGRVAPGWNAVLAYSWQLPQVTATQSSLAKTGAVMPFVPRHSLSLWARHDWSDRFGAALGVTARGSSFASTSNAVVLPGYARVDGALFYQPTTRLSLQLNVENLLGRGYYLSAFSDNNIMPRSPRSARITADVSF